MICCNIRLEDAFINGQRKKMANEICASPNSFRTNKIQFHRNIVLGKGNSVVFQGNYKDKKVAVKRILLNPDITEDVENGKIQMKLSHENVLKIFTVEDDLDFRYIVMELCAGTLFQVIEKTYKGPPLPSDNDVMYQIANGLSYIHSENIIHCDIKPENILISMEGKIKLSEIGLREQVTEEKCYITGLKGPFLWTAPECFPSKRNETNTKRTKESDVFSCGCVFFVFLTREKDPNGIHPFGDNFDHLQIYVNIKEGNSININRLTCLLGKLIEEMIQHNPMKRITSKRVKDKLCPISIGKRLHHKKNEIVGDANGASSASSKTLIIEAKDEELHSTIENCRYFVSLLNSVK